jgi:hypothetical protein
MMSIATRTPELTGISADAIPFDDLVAGQRPVILKGVVREWPLVRHGLTSAQDAIGYLTGFYQGQLVTSYVGAPGLKGRFHYTPQATALNFSFERLSLDTFFERIVAHITDPDPPSLYVSSTEVDTHLPGLRAENDLRPDHFHGASAPPLVSIWMGNHTIASAHWDSFHNLACCVVGQRRFTLFPPDQIENLYPGPLEPTPGGQVVSMVDFADPDLERFPRFAQALQAGQVAELDPGDVLFYPPLWWHHVEGLGSFNAMINYWWSTEPVFMDSPMNTLLHAMLSLRDRSEPEKRAWRAMFDYYIFGAPDRAATHLPEAAQGALAPLDERRARRLRAMLLNKFNR